MTKIVIAKTNILKAIFTNIINFHKLLKCYRNISTDNFPILVFKKALINLFYSESNEGEADIFTIIGKIDYQKLKDKIKAKKAKVIDKKISSKVIFVNDESKKTHKKQIQSKENINQKKKVGIASIRISEQKNLFSKTIVITPIISPKKKAIINVSNQEKIDKIGELKQSKIKENKVSLQNVSLVKKTIEKPNKTVNSRKTEIHLSKKENQKQDIIFKKTPKISSKPTIKNNKPKIQKYKLQKKSPSIMVALFSAVSASILFGLALGHKKAFTNILFASSLAFLGLGMFANKNKNKQLVKKI